MNATETVDLGSIPGRVKPNTIKIGIHSLASLLEVMHVRCHTHNRKLWLHHIESLFSRLETDALKKREEH